MAKATIRQREKGDLWIWATGSTVTMALLMVVVLMGVIAVNGLGYFWPKSLVELTLQDGTVLVGEEKRRETAERDGASVESVQLKIGNRDVYGLDFRWVETDSIESENRPALGRNGADGAW